MCICIYMSVHACIHPSIHPYIHTDIHTDIQTYKHTNVEIQIHANILQLYCIYTWYIKNELYRIHVPEYVYVSKWHMSLPCMCNMLPLALSSLNALVSGASQHEWLLKVSFSFWFYNSNPWVTKILRSCSLWARPAVPLAEGDLALHRGCQPGNVAWHVAWCAFAHVPGAALAEPCPRNQRASNENMHSTSEPSL